MLKNFLLMVLLAILQNEGIAQIDIEKLNLRFEKIENNIPKGWKTSGDKRNVFSIEKKTPDTTVLTIKNTTSTNEEGGILSLEIPDNLAGKKLTFLVDIKTDSIASDGAAGVYINISPKVAFNNLEELNINGTTDWNNYGVMVELSPKETKKIEIGLYLLGRGQAKFKNIRLLIDDSDISNAAIYKPQIESDTLYSLNSQVTVMEMTKQRVDRLKITAQIWGLLKYFHPEVATGKWDMDVELFKFIPRILESQSDKEIEKKLTNWIDKFGSCTPLAIVDTLGSHNIKLSADYSWIDKIQYSQTLKQKLKDLTKVKRADKNAYIDYANSSNQVIIKELKYASVPKSDVGFRLLGLFRYWNIIQYYYPYRYLMSEPWDNQLDNFIPKFVKANKASLLDSAYLQLISKINDTHGFTVLSDYYHTGVFGKRNIDVKTKIIDDKLIVSSLGVDSLNTELKVGDIIKTINGISTSDRIKSLRPLIAASNEPVSLRDIAPRVLQTDEDSLNITITRDSEAITLSVLTKPQTNIKMASSDKRPYYMLKDSVAYLNIGELVDENLNEFNEFLKASKALIIDFRHYPKTNIHHLLSKLLYKNATEYVKFSTNRGFAPGEFRFTEPAKVGKYNEDIYKGKIAVLINEYTQSAAEYQVMALRQAPNVTVVGSTTSGADGNVSWVPLPFGYKTAFSGIGVYYPDGTETQGIGIVPDITVKLSLEDVKTRHDPYVTKALELINKK